MTRSPDEIKKGLACASNCSDNIDGCKDCPYIGLDCPDLHFDAIALIQQLEAEIKDAKENHQHTIDIAEKQKEQIQKLKNVVVRLGNERDAAVGELVGTCQVCEWEDTEKCASCHFNTDAWNTYESNWKWRGVQKS